MSSSEETLYNNLAKITDIVKSMERCPFCNSEYAHTKECPIRRIERQRAINEHLDYATQEFVLAHTAGGIFERWNSKIEGDILDLLELFIKQNHSGFSGQAVLESFKQLAMFEPLTPLTGEPDEWVATDKPSIMQNSRCPSVFWNYETGVAVDTQAVLFKREGEPPFMTDDSSRVVKFPYMPIRQIMEIK